MREWPLESFELDQKVAITRDLKAPYWLRVIFVALDKPTKRTKVSCAYRGLRDLGKLRLRDGIHYGAELCDDNGTIIAERDWRPAAQKGA